MKSKIAQLLITLNKKLEVNFLDKTDVEIVQYADKLVSKAKIITILDKNELEGFIALYDNDLKNKVAFVSMLAVAYTSLGKSYGKLLMQSAINTVQVQGFIYLDIMIDEGNMRSVDFVNHFNFKRVEEETVVKYRKEL
tara:strand:+ start:42409 stop:42822 length:414 start_codon:yes stop_codon:yes gene_type:complete